MTRPSGRSKGLILSPKEGSARVPAPLYPAPSGDQASVSPSVVFSPGTGGRDLTGPPTLGPHQQLSGRISQGRGAGQALGWGPRGPGARVTGSVLAETRSAALATQGKPRRFEEITPTLPCHRLPEPREVSPWASSLKALHSSLTHSTNLQ